MKKPRLFIGSSIEGLSVAYALQENLHYSAEVTVWDQGVFKLSDTSIESLMTVIENSDFGVFVFTPDDITTIRGKKNATIRDNVLFELGLFIGRIGRNRSFIVMPDNSDFHLPTDLLGITPGKYESQRSDGNLNAGTGSVSNKIREVIKKLGFLHNQETQLDTVSQTGVPEKSKNEDYIEEIFVNKNYNKAIAILKKKIRYCKKEDERVNYENYICFCQSKIDYRDGLKHYQSLIIKYSSNNIAYKAYALTLMNNNNYSGALSVIEDGLKKCDRKIGLTLLKAECYWETSQKKEAIDVLKNSDLKNDPLIISKLSEYYADTGDLTSAFGVLKEGYKLNPLDKDLLTSFAKVSFNSNDYELALLLFTNLIEIEPDSPTNWCMLGNTYYHLTLHDSAINAYEKANSLAQERESWILNNIGNFYKDRGLYSKAIEALQKSNNLFAKSDYALDRLSGSYKSVEEEKRKISELISNAKSKL